MKHLSTLFIFLSLAIALTSCGKKDDTDQISPPIQIEDRDENIGSLYSKNDEGQLPQNGETWASLSGPKKISTHISMADGKQNKELNKPKEELIQNNNDGNNADSDEIPVEGNTGEEPNSAPKEGLVEIKNDDANDAGLEDGELAKGYLPGPFEMRFVQLPAGSFMMGKIGHQVEVTINEPFQIATTEVTQIQYKDVMHSLPEKLLEIENRAFLQDDKPVIFVSLNEAIIFTKILSAKDHDFDYRIPEEKQWEYAARGGTNTEYFCEESKLKDYAIYGRTWGHDSSEGPHTVEEKLPNPFKLYDMLGNVSEWCIDYYDTSMSPTKRAIRGGSYNCTLGSISPTTRIGVEPEFGSFSIGFRPVRTPKNKKAAL